MFKIILESELRVLEMHMVPDGQKNKHMEDAEHSNMAGNVSDHLSGKPITTVALPMSIN